MKALYEHGYSVPEDCSIIAIDGIELSQYVMPTLTTLVQPKEELGRQAARQLMDVLKNNGIHRHIHLATTLREGGTLQEVSNT